MPLFLVGFVSKFKPLYIKIFKRKLSIMLTLTKVLSKYDAIASTQDQLVLWRVDSYRLKISFNF